MVITVILSYLYVSSQKSAKGYLLQQLQFEYEELTSESKDLEAEVIEAQSITNIDEAEPAEKMERPEEEEFSFIGEESRFARN